MVYERRPSYNNTADISQSRLKTLAKFIYYKAFATVYSFMGSRSEVVMVNSSWTGNHIQSLWNIPQRTTVVYPPCNTGVFHKFALSPREKIIISIGQFRQEKNHMLQLSAFNQLLKSEQKLPNELRLILIGSLTKSHSHQDKERLDQLKLATKNFGIEEKVTFAINATNEELQFWTGKSLIGLHTMKDEHFGIGIVEMMAAGIIPVAHNSAGPKEDIIQPFDSKVVGFLACSEEEYVTKLKSILSISNDKQEEIQTNCRNTVDRFSDENFISHVKDLLLEIPLIKSALLGL